VTCSSSWLALFMLGCDELVAEGSEISSENMMFAFDVQSVSCYVTWSVAKV